MTAPPALSRHSPAGADVWFRDTDVLTPSDQAAALSLLSADERARYERFHFSRDRRDFAAAHALLRRSLSRYDLRPAAAWTFQTLTGGKPDLAGPGSPPLSFNLSHTHGLVACAITHGLDVGIDVETLDRVAATDAVAGRFFAASEIAALHACAEPARTTRFFDLWTLKEAYLKACGTGIVEGLNAVVFAFEGSHRLIFTPPPGVAAADWRFALFAPTPRHRMAVAVRGGRADIAVAARNDAGATELPPLRVSMGVG
jgi:4'-phosphopantetheinyl transferase